MRLFFLFFVLLSCTDESSTYYPLDKIKSWSYSVEIIPEVEKKVLYKKTNLSLGKKKIKISGESKNLFPVIREDGTTFFYEISKKGINRYGMKFLKDPQIKFEKNKRIVLPHPLKENKEWDVESKTYLILRRYPYYDYRATTEFKLNYKVVSLNESINTPNGKFNECILIRGEGNTKFIDNEIGSIDIKIVSEEWYSKKIGLVKMVRIEKTDTDLFGTTKMVQLLESFQKK
tara:strand:+ start:312 stop:1004 length:693 start_codon:yes stop_codon:yes gene_type:complete